ncbi:MAG: hypothetical protein WD044_17160 [Dongiaceae bacterium]
MPPCIDTIAVLIDPQLKLTRGAFLRRIVEDFWRGKGRRVKVHAPYEKAPKGMDAAIVHVDLTYIPPVFGECAAQYPVTLNGQVKDISKRRICTTLVGPDDSYAGPVMVKTDLNHRGAIEQRFRGYVPPDLSWVLPTGAYRVFDRKGDVPARVWSEPALVVQRLHVQRLGDRYQLNQWFFLGDRDIVSVWESSEPYVKRETVVHRPPFSYDVPDAIRRRRAELGFDYGKFDYVIEDGEAVLLDANMTPDNGGAIDNERCAVICGTLAPGIDAFAR